MAQDKNNKYIKNSNKSTNEKKEKTYRNPASSRWGKIIIFTLAAIMLFGGLTALIITMILTAR